MPEEKGLLFIGDPHLSSRAPGFRKDDYPATILEKLRWSLNYARENHLRPILLGDLFDFPRDNANWLIVRLLPLLEDETLAIYGNHDCKENALDENDTLSILVHANKIRLLDESRVWSGVMDGREVVVGGTSWGQKLPESFDPEAARPLQRLGLSVREIAPLVFWICHHDLKFPGQEEFTRIDCREIPGIDFIINGHIHRDMGRFQTGKTTWLNPGNISRLSRKDSSRTHIPSLLRADISQAGCELTRIAIPHQPYDEVFHPQTGEQAPSEAGSIFIQALANFESIRTASGAGLRAFLDANLAQFEPKIATEIQSLAEEVLQNAQSTNK